MSDKPSDERSKPVSRPVRFAGHVPTLIKPRKDPPSSALSNVTIEDGRIKLDEAVHMCNAIGHVLQAVPKKERKFTVTRLLNVAKTHRENGDSPLTYLTIEALVAGWEDWSNV